MPALPASAVVRPEITDPSDSPVDSTVAPARLGQSGHTPAAPCIHDHIPRFVDIAPV